MNRCPNCGNVFPPGYACQQCPCCGMNLMALQNMQYQMYKDARRSKAGWRFVFVVLELCSFSVALFLCWVISKVLDTDLFMRENYLIFVVWLFVAYQIYKKFKPRIM